MMDFGSMALERGGDEEEALGFKRTPNACHGEGTLIFEQGVHLRFGDSAVERALQDVSQHQAEFLKFGENGFRRLAFCGKLDGFEEGGRFTVEGLVWRIEEVGVELGCDSCEQEGLDVKWTKAC
jgi:hypothetical protein